MRKWLERHVYVTEPKFGFAAYRKPIPWFDKLLVVGGLAAGMAGRLTAGAWLLRLVVGGEAFGDLLPLLAVAVLLWLPGDYVRRTGNRGLIYHHMDLLAEYLAVQRDLHVHLPVNAGPSILHRPPAARRRER